MPFLITQFRTAKNDFDRCHIPLTLGKIGAATPHVLPFMLEALKNEGFNTRSFAAQWVGEMRSIEAVPALIQIKDTKEMSHVRVSTAEALEKIGGNKEAIIALAPVAREQSASHEIRGAALKALARVDQSASTLVMACLEAHRRLKSRT